MPRKNLDVNHIVVKVRRDELVELIKHNLNEAMSFVDEHKFDADHLKTFNFLQARANTYAEALSRRVEKRLKKDSAA
jgi:hypothetical protein